MDEFVLDRTGKAPLKFAGKKIRRSNGRYQNGTEQNRWHVIELFRAQGGKYVLAISYRTLWDGESHEHTVAVCESPSAVIHELESFDPTAPVKAYGSNPAYAEKNAQLRDGVRMRYATQVSEILEGREFAETID